MQKSLLKSVRIIAVGVSVMSKSYKLKYITASSPKWENHSCWVEGETLTDARRNLEKRHTKGMFRHTGVEDIKEEVV